MGSVRSVLSASLLGCIALGSLVVFQNCQPSRQAPSSTANEETDHPSTIPDSENIVHAFKSREEAVAAPFAGGKVRILKVGGESIAKVRRKTGEKVVFPVGQRLIAVLDNSCAREERGLVSARFYNPDLELPELSTQSYVHVLKTPLDFDELSQAAAEDPCLIGITHDDVIHASILNDSNLSKQMNFLSIGGPETDIFFSDPVRGSRAPVVVSVIDSGINHNHEDLKNRLWRNPNPNPPAAGTYGYNFYANNYSVFDDFGHGTFVAGIIAAEAGNGLGIAGVMGHDVQIQALKVQDSQGNAFISNIVTAVEYATARGAHVINISMEGTGDQPALQSALNAAVTANIFVAVAAGNSNELLDDSNIVVPAHYGSSLAGMMTVGSIDSYSGQKSSFSNFGTSHVEIAAPGSNGVYSTNKDGGYSSNQGTSFSSPLVAGAGALVISFFKKNNISYTASMVEDAITNSALQKSELAGSFTQGRILDLRSLAKYLQRKYLSPVEGGFNEK